MNGAPIDVPEDLRFTRRSWAAERVGWLLLAALVAAGLAGLLGPGPLSWTRAVGAPGAPDVAYDRFLHRQTETRLEVRLPAEGVRDGAVRLWIDRGWLEAVEVIRVQPAPRSVQAEADRTVYTFDADGGPEVAFDVEFERAGRPAGRFGIVGGAAVEVRQVVYP